MVGGDNWCPDPASLPPQCMHVIASGRSSHSAVVSLGFYIFR